MKNLTIVLAVFLSCARTATPDDPKVPTATSRIRSPISLSWKEVERGDHKVVLEASVKHVAPVPVPLAVSITLPEGATLVSGKTAAAIPANAEAGVLVQPLELAFASVPAGNVELHVDGESTSMGFHLNAEYRFGRPAPEVVPVKAEGSNVIINGRDLGPSVELH